MRRIAAIAAALLLVSLPSSAQAPVQPAGTIVVAIAVSDGMTLLPAALWTCEAVR